MSKRLRLILALLLAALSLTAISVSFWYQDWQYSLPTPKPAHLQQPPFGSAIQLPPGLARFKQPNRPLFLHFLNSQCPCSRFNLDHVRSLTRRFGSGVDFVAVLQSRISGADLHLPMPVVGDQDGRLGLILGVYSTPQAVLLTQTGRLYFRGNYNISRYCMNETTEFARLALTSLVNGKMLPIFPEQAVIAYGCPLKKMFRAAVPGRGDR